MGDVARVSLLSELPSRYWPELENCVAAYERDVGLGQARSLYDYLPAGERALRQATLVELVKVELELRRRAGESPRWEEYAEALDSQLGDSRLHRELAHESRPSSASRDSQFTLPPLAGLSDTWPAPATTPGAPDQTIGDFQILELLGEGAFAKVYLARQISLNRRVALKVTANRDAEGETLARLDHDHIVRVYSESIDAPTNLRTICMQYVAGATLAGAIERLNQTGEEWNGRQFVDAVAELASQPEMLRPEGLRVREALCDFDLSQTVAWIGERLADALAHAHAQGVLHHDIKPANILIDQYGRPYLADFNLSSVHHDADCAPERLGGTLPYMAPEQMAAIGRMSVVEAARVNQRSDLYSLGVVLYELATGARPFPDISQPGDASDLLASANDARRLGCPSLHQRRDGISPALDQIVRRCLAHDPEQRFQSAADLGAALAGARRLRSAEAAMPRAGRLTNAAARRPLLWMFLLTFPPHLIGAALNIGYIVLYIYGGLTAAQQACYHVLSPIYTTAAFAITSCLAWRMSIPLARAARRLRAREDIPETEAAVIRRQARAAPMRNAAISAVGWLPGAIFFPLALHLLAGPASPDVFVHFGVIFFISLAIAATWSYFTSEFLFLRVNYLDLLAGTPDPQETARQELASIPRRIRWFQLLTGVIPLLAAVLGIAVSPETAPERYGAFRLLLAALVLLGALGVALAAPFAGLLNACYAALIGADERRRER
jgi:serine/threonine protein kinase